MRTSTQQQQQVVTDDPFYPNGLEAVAAPRLHFLHVGLWCTRTPDYFRHRAPQQLAAAAAAATMSSSSTAATSAASPLDVSLLSTPNVFERSGRGAPPAASGGTPSASPLIPPPPTSAGAGSSASPTASATSTTTSTANHDAVWLHRARPRDRFVFLVTPVAGGLPQLSLREKIMKAVYGVAPRFAVSGRAGGGRRSRRGVEAIEVLHADVTALDYSSALTGQRLAIETRHAVSRWFPSIAAAEAHYEVATPSVVLAPPPSKLVGRPVASSATSAPATPAQGPAAAPSTPASLPTMVSASGGNAGALPPQNVGKLPPADTTGRVTPPPGTPDGLGASPPPTPLVDPLPQQHAPGASFAAFHGSLTQEEFPDSLEREIRNTMVVAFSQDPAFTAALRELLQPSYTQGLLHARSAALNPVAAGSAGLGLASLLGVGSHAASPAKAAEGADRPLPANAPVQPFAATAESQARLLSLYEAGIPSWAVFCCRWGLPYRRSFRVVAVTALNVWPFIALLVGLYDLYKHMPYMRDWLDPFTAWMDNHFTLRVSVAVAYCVTLLLQALDTVVRLVKGLGAIVGFFVSPLYPLWQLVLLLQGPVFAMGRLVGTVALPLVALVKLSWTLVASTLMLPWYTTQLVVALTTAKTAVEPVAGGVRAASEGFRFWRSMMKFWAEVARPVKNLLKAIYDGIMHVGMWIVRREISLRNWYSAKWAALVDGVTDALHALEAEYRSPTWRSALFFGVLGVVLAVLWQLGLVAALFGFAE